MLEDDAYGDAMRPWQVVAIMSRERLDELIHQKRRHDEDCRRASRGGPPVVEDGVFPSTSVSHLLEGNVTTDENELVDGDVVKNARRACRDGQSDGIDQARAALAKGLPHARAAVSYCLREQETPGRRWRSPRKVTRPRRCWREPWPCSTFIHRAARCKL